MEAFVSHAWNSRFLLSSSSHTVETITYRQVHPTFRELASHRARILSMSLCQVRKSLSIVRCPFCKKVACVDLRLQCSQLTACRPVRDLLLQAVITSRGFSSTHAARVTFGPWAYKWAHPLKLHQQIICNITCTQTFCGRLAMNLCILAPCVKTCLLHASLQAVTAVFAVAT